MATPESQGGIDYPDGGFSSGGVTYPLAGDLGELAARQGSVVTHNREGNVIFVGTFEHGLAGWAEATYGTGAEIITSAERYRSSGYSCKLTAGSDGAKQAKIFREFPIPHVGTYGLEASWMPQTECNDFYMRLAWIDGTEEHQFTVGYQDATGKLAYRNESGGWDTIATGVDLTFGYKPIHTFKIVADFDSKEYLRFIANNTEYDISGNAGYSFSRVEAAHLEIVIYVTSDTGKNEGVWTDDIILTYNEPTRE